MQNLDLREILKNVPEGTMLYSTIHGNLRFDCVDYDDNLYPIKCNRSGYKYPFTKEGKYLHNYDGECVLFPSNEQRNWNKFELPCQFKIGDVICCKNHELISIYKGDNKRFDVFTGIKQKTAHINIFNLHSFVDINTSDYRLATIDEEKIFYNNLKDAGYFWNNLTESLDKFKFKVGDKIQDKTTKEIYIIYDIDRDKYKVKENIQCYIIADYQNQYELYQEKFDINNLKPYDKVLVRYFNDSVWKPSLFSHLDIDLKNGNYKFAIIGTSAPQCIPYEGNEHLTGTTNNCDEYYKNW